MPVVNVHEAKTTLSALLARAQAGEDIIIARNGKPVARLVPLAPGNPKRTPGLLAGKLQIPDDFDAPLPDDILDSFEAP